jgi:hypothetical protein
MPVVLSVSYTSFRNSGFGLHERILEPHSCANAEGCQHDVEYDSDMAVRTRGNSVWWSGIVVS